LKRIEEKRPKFSYRRVISNKTQFGAIVTDTPFPRPAALDHAVIGMCGVTGFLRRGKDKRQSER